MKYVIYLRVSTDQQVSSGLGLEAQRQICLKLVRYRNRFKRNFINIFKEILKELPESKIELVPDDPKDQEIANQMTALLRYQKNKCACHT